MNPTILAESGKLTYTGPKLPLPLNSGMTVEEIGRHLTLRPDRVQGVLDALDILPYRAVAKAYGMDEDTVREIARLAGR